MKFHQLPVGSDFTLDGNRYRKVSLLLARREADGLDVLIRRSTAVTAGSHAAAPATPPRPLDSAAVKHAIEDFFQACRHCLAGGTALPTEQRERHLAAARQHFLQRLQLDD